jgi:predicted small lipoprotein YifL
MMLQRVLMCLALCAGLAGCGAKSVYAPDEAVQAAAFVAEGPTSITLMTVINNRSGGGAHSGLLINGSQRVMFDPAGSWYHPQLPERNDVHFGMTDRMVNFYLDYHARKTYRVVQQTVVVTPEVAQLVMTRALEYGPVPQAQCSHSIATVLRGVPGFEGLPDTWFPKRLSAGFAALPGVTEKVTRDEDADDNHGVLLVQANGQPSDN